MKHSKELKEIFPALSKVREKLKQPTKDKKGYNYKYTDLAGVAKVIDEAIKGTGIDYRQEVFTSESGLPAVITIITHTSGEYLIFDPLSLPVQKKDAQGYGSAITYARRYQLQAAFGIASEDDDGEAASQNRNNNPQQGQPRNNGYRNQPNNYQNNGGY